MHDSVFGQARQLREQAEAMLRQGREESARLERHWKAALGEQKAELSRQMKHLESSMATLKGAKHSLEAQVKVLYWPLSRPVARSQERRCGDYMEK